MVSSHHNGIKSGTVLIDTFSINHYLTAGFEVWVREGPWSLQELLDMIPPSLPFTVSSTSFHHHPEEIIDKLLNLLIS